MGWFFTHLTKIIGIARQANTEMVLPNPINNGTSSQGIFRVGDPICQLGTPVFCLKVSLVQDS